MIISTDYSPGMFSNTRKYFDTKIKFLIDCNGNVIAKYNPGFKIKNTKNFLDIIREVKRNKKYQNLKILYITIINDDKFLNFIFKKDEIVVELIYWNISSENYFLKGDG
jgi:hypothetical protein